MRKILPHSSKRWFILAKEEIKRNSKCFRSDKRGKFLHFSESNLKIDIITDYIWCRKNSECRDIGVQFVDKDTGFRTRIIKQVCHIEYYKRKVSETEGRKLSGEQAAMMWMKKYARDLPNRMERYDRIVSSDLS